MTDARDFDLERDMLSAYLDGELTDDERAAVEARLEVSSEWRDELVEVESARTIVRGLPTRDAPPGFWDRVVAHVEAEADAGSAIEAPTPVAPVVPIATARGTRRGARTSRGRVVTWLAGAAAAVAAVAVVVTLPGQRTVKPNVTAVSTQHGASTSNSGDPISGLVPVGVVS